MNTIIYSNGGNGNNIEDVDALFSRLQKSPLDPSFDAYDCLYQNENGEHRFFGNFATYSHAFRIKTTDLKLAIRLRTAITRNLRSDQYQQAKADFGLHERRALRRLEKHKARKRA
jgi:hypothetical protein